VLQQFARDSGGLTISADRQAPAQAHGQESKQKVQRRLWSLEEDEKLGVAEGRLGVPGGGWDLAIVGRSVQVGGGYIDYEENDLARKKPAVAVFASPSQPKIFPLPPITSNLSTHAWSIKYK
jgi:hypothetical protein